MTGKGAANGCSGFSGSCCRECGGLPDFVDQARPFLTAAVDYDPEAVRKHLRTADLDEHVDALDRALDRMPEPFDEATIERVLRGVADARGIKAAALIHAARIAAMGKAVSPGIFEVLALLGKPLTLSRLRDLVRFLAPHAELKRSYGVFFLNVYPTTNFNVGALPLPILKSVKNPFSCAKPNVKNEPACMLVSSLRRRKTTAGPPP